MNYYNEFDPSAAAWLRELIANKIIPAGHVDTRSIADVSPSDLRGFTQCHFFAGIGGWAEALRLAGWPADLPVWTGSCPCQPFSAAGRQRGTDDERHLWPEFYRLIRECRPTVVFGEQVASTLGREWLSGVRADLEGVGHEVGAADLCAAGVGAPHIRQRLYWVAHSNRSRIPRLEQSGNPSCVRQWNWRGKEDLLDLASNPFSANDRWPQPIVRGMDDGIFARVVRLRGYGNAIVPQVAAEFIGAFCEAFEMKKDLT